MYTVKTMKRIMLNVVFQTLSMEAIQVSLEFEVKLHVNVYSQRIWTCKSSYRSNFLQILNWYSYVHVFLRIVENFHIAYSKTYNKELE